MVVHPSAFVLFSDVRNRSDELPFYGTAANQIVSLPRRTATRRAFLPAQQGGNITFSDGHAAYFKYDYVVSDGAAITPSACQPAIRSPPATTPAKRTSIGIVSGIRLIN